MEGELPGEALRPDSTITSRSPAALELTRQTVPSPAMQEMFCVFCFGFNSELNKDLAGGRWSAAQGAHPCLPNRVPKPAEQLGLQGTSLSSLEGPIPGPPGPPLGIGTRGHLGQAPQGSRLCSWRLPPHTVGGGTNIIPILWMRRQAHLDRVTLQHHRQSQVASHPVRAQSSRW